jgi:hypothetical protein
MSSWATRVRRLLTSQVVIILVADTVGHERRGPAGTAAGCKLPDWLLHAMLARGAAAAGLCCCCHRSCWLLRAAPPCPCLQLLAAGWLLLLRLDARNTATHGTVDLPYGC